MAVTVLLNAASGSGSAAEAARTIERLFGEAGREAQIELVESGDRLRSLARDAARARKRSSPAAETGPSTPSPQSSPAVTSPSASSRSAR